MEIDGKKVSVYEPYGPEWEKEILQLDKKTIMKMLRMKGTSLDLQDHCSKELRAGLAEAAKQRDDLRVIVKDLLDIQDMNCDCEPVEAPDHECFVCETQRKAREILT